MGAAPGLAARPTGGRAWRAGGAGGCYCCDGRCRPCCWFRRRAGSRCRRHPGSSQGLDGTDEPGPGAAWPLVPRLGGCFFGRVTYRQQ